MKAFIVCACLVSGVLVLSAAPWAGTPIRALIEGCQNDEYFDLVEKACVKGGRVPNIAGHSQEEVGEIAARWGAKLREYKGVSSVWVDRHGIRIEVDPDHATDIPTEVEGVPVNQIPTQVRQGADLAPPQ